MLIYKIAYRHVYCIAQSEGVELELQLLYFARGISQYGQSTEIDCGWM
jgi:hypothetical protein